MEQNQSLVALSRELAAAVEKVSPVVVAVNARPRVATSGVLWRPGIVVATNHTIKREEEITVWLNDGREVAATLLGRDPSTDLAVLKIDGTSSAAEIATDPEAIKTGHLVLAVGRTGDEGVSASLGCISAVGGSWRTWQGGMLDRFVRLDLNIYLGFSGSPLVSAEGRVLGINTSGLARGAAVTIPAVTVDRVVDAVLKQGRVARPYLGVGMQPVRLTENLKNALHLSHDGGVVLLSVEPGSPADQAGFLIGDVLVSLGGTAIEDTDDVQKALAPDSIGRSLEAIIIRGGQRVTAAIVVGERPARKK